jgi:hypothetical protein
MRASLLRVALACGTAGVLLCQCDEKAGPSGGNGPGSAGADSDASAPSGGSGGASGAGTTEHVGGAGNGSAGAATGGTASGGAAGATGRPVPGPECIAPCIWELMERCRPTGPCTRAIVDTTTVHFCYSDGGSMFMNPDELHAFMPDGSACYSVEFTSNTDRVWYDGTGTAVATETEEADGAQTVVCGGNEYHVDVNTPECQAALDAPECSTGECVAGP